ncbi:MAG TPA: non-homologous end-joining DNA ligase [Bryobacteraceae bacterium]|nr:non-homologous end-joining DNA ligase [Bryobacteraceae bacterium]
MFESVSADVQPQKLMGNLRVGKQTIKTSSEDRIIFPRDGITKGDVIEYYRHVSRWMVPHLRGRRLTMQRFNPDINGEGIFQKDIPKHFPDWVSRVTVPKHGGTVTHVVCDNAETLVYLANQGFLTYHVGLARVDRNEEPDQMMFDIDPPSADFECVRPIAFALRSLLEELGLPCFAKTTGSRGLHVVVPVGRAQTFDEVREFAHQVSLLLVRRMPKQTTVEFYKEKRGDRVFLDTNRNAVAQTAVPAFSVRAVDGAPVAMPITWEEVADGNLNARTFTIRNAVERMKTVKDPMSGMSRSAKSLRAAADRLAKLL